VFKVFAYELVNEEKKTITLEMQAPTREIQQPVIKM
jgi:hypothetical protein